MKPVAKWLLRIIVLIVAAWLAWTYFAELTNEQPSHIASGNGRIEAVEINIAAKTPGRIASIDVREGEFVHRGDRLATLDTAAMQAQLHQAEAQHRQAQSAAPTTHFIELSQAILFRGAGLRIIWPQLFALIVIGLGLFIIALARFRKTLASMA